MVRKVVHFLLPRHMLVIEEGLRDVFAVQRVVQILFAFLHFSAYAPIALNA